MKERMTESKKISGVDPNTWGRFDEGVDKVSKVAAKVLPFTAVGGVLAGCVIDTGTPIEAVSTLEASPVPGTGEFSVLFTPSSLQNLDSGTKEIVSKNLELIAGECKKDLPGMIEGSEKYLYSRNMSNDIFVWGFCDVIADANGPERTVVSAFDWMAGPSGEMTKINRDLILFDDGTIGYVDTEGNSHAVMKKTESSLVDVYDIKENVIASQQMTPEALSFFGKIQSVSAEAMPIPTIEATEIVEVTETEEIVGGKALVEQLVFEREIPDLSQEEMADIVANAYRFKSDSGEIYSLGYFSMQQGYIGLEGIFIDLEKSASRVNGNEFWRLLMITELKKAGSYETTDEKKYIVVPVYFDNDDNNTSKMGLATNIMGSESSMGIYDFVQALDEHKNKHGYFQVIAYNQFYYTEAMVEEHKAMSNWLRVREYVMRIYNGSEEAKIFEKYVIKHDYDGVSNCVKNEKPFLRTISVTISGD